MQSPDPSFHKIPHANIVTGTRLCGEKTFSAKYNGNFFDTLVMEQTWAGLRKIINSEM